MKKTLIGILSLVLALPLMASQPTTTRAKSYDSERYRVDLNSFTATTGFDSIIVLNRSDVSVETGGFEANRTIFCLQFVTNQTTASKSDWDVLWQVSGVQSGLLQTVFPSESGYLDWNTVETDQNDNSLSWVATFDAAAYKGMRVRAILAEADDSTDEADEIEVYFVYPVD